jgi:hypothetical protein
MIGNNVREARFEVGEFEERSQKKKTKDKGEKKVFCKEGKTKRENGGFFFVLGDNCGEI